MESELYTSSLVAISLGESVKDVSNDLRRLHQMGFLKRKRRRRFCVSKTGKPCYKGCEYVYSLSDQGKSYLMWMNNQKPMEDLAQIMLGEEILGYLPKELKDRLLAVIAIRSSYRYSGPNRHFRLIENEALPIANLHLENQKLSEEKRILSKDNETLTSSLAFYKGLSADLTRERKISKRPFLTLSQKHQDPLGFMMKSLTFCKRELGNRTIPRN
jgi:hypothetical protein